MRTADVVLVGLESCSDVRKNEPKPPGVEPTAGITPESSGSELVSCTSGRVSRFMLNEVMLRPVTMSPLVTREKSP